MSLIAKCKMRCIDGSEATTIDTAREGVDDVNYVNSTRFEIVSFGKIIFHTLKNSMEQKHFHT